MPSLGSFFLEYATLLVSTKKAADEELMSLGQHLGTSKSTETLSMVACSSSTSAPYLY
jgi:hypothetical protein